MTAYITFTNADGSTTLVEVDEDEIKPGKSVKAGLLDQVKGSVSNAATTLQAALTNAIRTNVDALYSSVRDLPSPPSEIEMAFSLKATGEMGNIAIGKAGGDANYSIKLMWKTKPPGTAC